MSEQKTPQITMESLSADSKALFWPVPPEMISGYFTICGRVVSLKRNF